MKRLLGLLLVSTSMVSFANDKVTLQYELSSNGCTTGVHTFHGEAFNEVQGKVCLALQNDELNNNCASSLRMMKAKNECKTSEVKTFKDKLCYKTVTSHISRYEYDELSEVQGILKTCSAKKDFNLECINTVLNNVPRFEYDEKDEFFKVLNMCETWNKSIKNCVELITIDIHRFEYDELSEFSSIINTCKF